jgi:hypothetical protein
MFSTPILRHACSVVEAWLTQTETYFCTNPVYTFDVLAKYTWPMIPSAMDAFLWGVYFKKRQGSPSRFVFLLTFSEESI